MRGAPTILAVGKIERANRAGQSFIYYTLLTGFVLALLACVGVPLAFWLVG